MTVKQKKFFVPREYEKAGRITILEASQLARGAARVFHEQAYGLDCDGKCHPDRAAPGFSYTGNIQGGGQFRVTVELVEEEKERIQ